MSATARALASGSLQRLIALLGAGLCLLAPALGAEGRAVLAAAGDGLSWRGYLGIPPVERPNRPGIPLRRTGAYEREYWYRYERARRTGRIPRGAEHAARMRAARFRQAALARFRRVKRPNMAAALAGTTWAELGPRGIESEEAPLGPVSGRVTCVLLQKANDRILLGSASGGIWRASLSGFSGWTAVGDSLASLSIGALAEDPQNPDIVYAGTGEPGICLDCFTGSGLFRSIDGGSTWARRDDGTLTGSKITGVWVDPRDSNRILLSTLNSGFFRSTNGGVGWVRLLTGSYMGFSVSPFDPDGILLSNSEPFGDAGYNLLRSTNGSSFAAVGSPPWQGEGTTVGRIDIAYSPSEFGVVYCSVAPPIPPASDNGRSGIYRSLDGGATWVRVFDAPHVSGGETLGWYTNPIAVAPSDSRLVFVGGVDLYSGRVGSGTTMTRRTTWSPFVDASLPSIHADQHALTFCPWDPKTLFAANDGGLYRSDDNGVTWAHMNTGLGITQFYAGTVGAADGLAHLFGGSQDNGSSRVFSGQTWYSGLGGDGFQCVASPTPGVMHGTTQYGSFHSSTDSGYSFPQVSSPFGGGGTSSPRGTGAEVAPFFTPLALSPSDGSYLTAGQNAYTGTYNAQDGMLWSRASTPQLFSGAAVARSAAVAPFNSDVMGVVGDVKVFIRSGRGSPWVDRSPGGGLFCTDIAFNPDNDNEIIVTRSGFGGGQVIRSINGGVSWTSITGTGGAALPDTPVNSVLLSSRAGRLDCFVAADTGVYYSDLNVAPVQWSPVGTGLPNVVCYEVVLADGGDSVVVFTHGRGAWLVRTPVPTIAIQYPNGGESLPGGVQQQITWQSSGITGTVRIELSVTGGETWTLLSSSAPNTGSFPWTPPEGTFSDALIRVKSVGSPDVYDRSDRPFNIFSGSAFAVSGNVSRGGAPLAGVSMSLRPIYSGASTAGGAIPNGTGDISTSIVLTAPGRRVGTLEVAVSISHHDRGQLRVTLTAPSGDSVRLHDQTGFVLRDLNTTYPTATRPVESFARFENQLLDGAWTLTVADLDPNGLAGSLVSWSLTVRDVEVRVQASASDGSFVFPNLAPSQYQLLPPADHVVTPESRLVTVGPDATGQNFVVEDTYSISGSLSDPTGQATGPGSPSGAAISDAVVALQSGTTQPLIFTSTPHYAIPDNNPAIFDISLPVDAPGTVQSLLFSVDVVHTYIAELEIFLVPPDGDWVRVYSVSRFGHNLKVTFPVDHPGDESLARLTGKTIRGTWRVWIRDLGAGDTGTLRAFTLAFLPASTRHATTAADGAFSFTQLRAGDYRVTPVKAGYVFTPASVPATLPPTIESMSFQGVQAIYSISGTVTLNGSGTAGIRVAAGGRSTLTGAGGTYTLANLPAGSYAVQASLPDATFTPPFQIARIGPANATGINFAGLGSGSGRPGRGGRRR